MLLWLNDWRKEWIRERVCEWRKEGVKLHTMLRQGENETRVRIRRLSSHWIWNDHFIKKGGKNFKRDLLHGFETLYNNFRNCYPGLTKLCQLSVPMQHLCSKCSFEASETLLCKAEMSWIELHYCIHIEGQGLHLH